METDATPVAFTTTVASDIIVITQVSGLVTVWRRADDPVLFDAWISGTLALATMFDAAKNSVFYPQNDDDPGDLEALLDPDLPLPNGDFSEPQPGGSFLHVVPVLTDGLEDGEADEVSAEDLYHQGVVDGRSDVLKALAEDPDMAVGDPLEGELMSYDHGYDHGWTTEYRDHKAAVALAEMDRLSRIAAAHALEDTQSLGARSPIYGHTSPQENRDDPQWHVNLSPKDIERFVLEAALASDVAVPMATLRPRRQ